MSKLRALFLAHCIKSKKHDRAIELLEEGDIEINDKQWDAGFIALLLLHSKECDILKLSKLVELLLTRGADPNVFFMGGPSFWGIWTDGLYKIEGMQHLWNVFLKSNKIDWSLLADQEDPMHFLQWNCIEPDECCTAILEPALISGASAFINVPCVISRATCLHLIAQWDVDQQDKAIDLIRLFLKYGADQNAQDKEGRTPLARYIKYQQEDSNPDIIFELISQTGTNMSIVDDDGLTCLQQLNNCFNPVRDLEEVTCILIQNMLIEAEKEWTKYEKETRNTLSNVFSLDLVHMIMQSAFNCSISTSKKRKRNTE